MNVLVLQPIRPDHLPALRMVADQLLSRLESANPGMAFDIQQDDARLDIPPHGSRYMRHAAVRNYMVDTYLRPEHDAVLWVDSDLIDYPADLPSLLHRAAPGAVCAPLALLVDTSPYGAGRFYDIGGFVERGRSARGYPPYFAQAGDVIDLDSVGCCYLAPAALYRAGVRYEPPPQDRWTTMDGTEYRVEHNSVMAAARRRGYRVCCLTTARAVHAWLPDYGLSPNE